MQNYIGIVGTGRCGTQFSTVFFREVFKLDIGHEQHGYDGIAHYKLALVANKCNYQINGFGKNKLIFHQVREPMKVISSLMKRDIIGMSHVYLPEINEDDPQLIKCAKYYYYWNKLPYALYNIDLRYKVEDMQTEHFIKALCKVLQESYSPELLKKANSLNTKINTSYFPDGKPDENYTSHPGKIITKRYGLKDIYEIDVKTAQLIADMGMEYGYY